MRRRRHADAGRDRRDDFYVIRPDEYAQHVVAWAMKAIELGSRQSMERVDVHGPLVRWLLNYLPSAAGEGIASGNYANKMIAVMRDPRPGRGWVALLMEPNGQMVASAPVDADAPPPPTAVPVLPPQLLGVVP